MTPLLFFGETCLKNISLIDAECIARNCNKELLIAKEGSNQAEQRKKQAISRWFPSINYQGQFHVVEKAEEFLNIFNPEDPFTISHRGYRSVLQLDQPLFSTDLIFNLKSKKIEEVAFDFEQANTLNELLLAVRRNYYSVIAYEVSLQVERENINFLSYALDLEQKKLTAGNSTALEVNQSKVAVANAISLYYSTLKNLKYARNALILTLGVDPLLEPELTLEQAQIPIDHTPEISLKLQEVESRYNYLDSAMPTTKDFLNHVDSIEKARKLTLFSDEDVLKYLEFAFSNRPDLLKSKLQVGVANQNLGQKQGKYLPKLDGFARYSYNDANIGPHPFGTQNYNWSGGLVLKWNLFDGLLREHEIKEARSAKQSYQLNYDKIFQKVEVEIRNGLYELEEAMMCYLSSSQAVLLAEQARLQAADKLEYGRIPPLEYRDSVNLLLQSRNQKTKASLDLISAYYQLRYATGADAFSPSNKL